MEKGQVTLSKDSKEIEFSKHCKLNLGRLKYEQKEEWCGHKKFKPTSPGRRFMTVSTFEEITKKEPERSLVETLKNKAGAMPMEE